MPSARKTERRTVMEVKMIREYVSMLEKEGLLDFVIGADGHKKLEASVKDISYNSMLCGEGTLFICKGANFKAEYLEDALKKGACGCVADSKAPWLLQQKDILKEIPCLGV